MITYRDGSIVPTQSWMLWREDGHWSIDVKGFVNTSVIPAELIDALDVFFKVLGYLFLVIVHIYAYKIDRDRKSVV